MATLTEFLLARIADDEAILEGIGDCRRVDLVIDDPWFAQHHRAECEAKRRIVDRLRAWDEDRSWTRDMELQDAGSDAEAILCDLAAVYADHPDYREEWRP